MIKVKYIYSACVVIETEDIRVLCDPWFTEGIYDGSWFHFPEVPSPISMIGDVDLVYISHIHPDHYDPIFLRDYLDEFGSKPILIAGYVSNFLERKMKTDGFDPIILDPRETYKSGNTSIKVIPDFSGSESDIDSFMVVEYRSPEKLHCVVNLNDCIPSEKLAADVKEAVSGSIDILLCGYTGAGPYPQTYYTIDNPILAEKAEDKKKRFFERYRFITSELGARVNVPFAGQYVLGGRLAYLNEFRGVADAVEVLDFDPDAQVLQPGAFVDSSSHEGSSLRTIKHSEEDLFKRLTNISCSAMDYEMFIPDESIAQIPLSRLMSKALERALSKSEVVSDYFISFRMDDHWLWFNARHGGSPLISRAEILDEIPCPRSVITIDRRYLFGLMVGAFHWNNAEVGSQFFVEREPDVFELAVQNFLNFFSLV